MELSVCGLLLYCVVVLLCLGRYFGVDNLRIDKQLFKMIKLFILCYGFQGRGGFFCRYWCFYLCMLRQILCIICFGYIVNCYDKKWVFLIFGGVVVWFIRIWYNLCNEEVDSVIWCSSSSMIFFLWFFCLFVFCVVLDSFIELFICLFEGVMVL